MSKKTSVAQAFVARLVMSEKMLGTTACWDMYLADNTDPAHGLFCALYEYLRRRFRMARPNGFMFGGTWHPDVEETQACCRKLKPPSSKFPWTYYRHCNTTTHLAHKWGVSPEELTAIARLYLKRRGREAILEDMGHSKVYQYHQSRAAARRRLRQKAIRKFHVISTI